MVYGLLGEIFMNCCSITKERGGKPIDYYRTTEFLETINCFEFIDIGYKESKYTWLNKRFTNKSSLIFERLDIFLANNEWLQKYHDAHVFHLLRTHSDHCPLLVSFIKSSQDKK